MSIEEQSLDQDGSLPHPTCSSALPLFSSLCGRGCLSVRTLRWWWCRFALNEQREGHHHHHRPAGSFLSSPASALIALITAVFHLHQPRFHVEGFPLFLFKKDLFGLAQQFYDALLLMCSNIARGGVIISSAFSFLFLRAKLCGSDLPLKLRLVFWSSSLQQLQASLQWMIDGLSL